MNRLPSVIGPAPSELPLEALHARLRIERDRVRSALQAFKDGYALAKPAKTARTKTARAKQPSKAAKFDNLASQYGLSPEELMNLLKEDTA